MAGLYPCSDGSKTLKRRTQIDYLPREYVLRSGQRIVIRNYNDEEDEQRFFLMIQSDSAKGNGYTVDEFPTIDCFRAVVTKDVCLAFDDVETGRLIGYPTFNPQPVYLRSQRRKVVEIIFSFSAQSRGKGISTEIIMLIDCLKYELGYEALINDTFLPNYPLFRTINQTAGVSYAGMLPRYAYRFGAGWEDGLIIYDDMVHSKVAMTLRALLDENTKRAAKL